MQVDFYQLSDKPVEAVVSELAQKTLENGERLLVIAGDDKLRAMLDERLWTADPASFVPHGQAGSDNDSTQPVLLSQIPEPANAAKFSLIADGKWRDEALAAERIFYLFDRDTIDGARDAWRMLSERGDVTTHYWKRVNGRWVKGP